ncbi:MAG: hypothetical protein JXJ19_08880 [Elusimicrobia bacterium]|nr:hypothetical protein [Elusimicrobiota bacterium]
MKSKPIGYLLISAVILLFLSAGYVPAAENFDKVSIYGGEVEHIALCHDKPEVMYAGASHGNLWISKNSGKTWSTTKMRDANTSGSGMFAVHPEKPGTIVAFASENGRLVRSTDYGETWTENEFLYENNISIVKLEFSPDDPDTVYLLGNNTSEDEAEVYISKNSGKTWSKTDFDSDGNPGMDLCVDEDGNVFVAVIDAEVETFLSWDEAGSGTLFMSDDEGDSWEELDSVDLSANGPILLHSCNGTTAVAVHGDDPNIWVTMDEGDSFTAISAATLDIQTGFEFAVGLDGESVLLNDFNGIQRSTYAAGTGWADPVVISTTEYRIDTSEILINPEDEDDIYMSDGYEHAFFISTDGGEDWEISNEGLDGFQVQDGVKNKKGYIYVLGRASIFKSEDNGKSWDKVYGYNPGSGTVSGFDGGAIGVCEDTSKDYVFAAGDSKLWKSSDGGATWDTVLEYPHDYLPAQDIVFNPEDKEIGYIAFNDVQADDETSEKYIYKTEDCGETWEPLNIKTMGVQALAMDPSDPEVLYVGLGEVNPWDNGKAIALGGLYRIKDTGSSVSISKVGLNKTIPYCITVDPDDSDILYAACIESLSDIYGPVFVSRDGGATWDEVATDESNESYPWNNGGAGDIKVTDSVLYFSNMGGVFACINAGLDTEGYQNVATNAEVGGVQCLIKGSLYAGTDTGLWKYSGDLKFIELDTDSGQVKVQGGENGYVNPSKGEVARVYFNAKKSGKVTVRVFTKKGQLVWEDSKNTSGEEDYVEWACKNAEDHVVASGIYIVNIDGPGISESSKIAVLK